MGRLKSEGVVSGLAGNARSFKGLELCVQVGQNAFEMRAIAGIARALQRHQCPRANHVQPVLPGSNLKCLWVGLRYCTQLDGPFAFADLIFDGLTFPASCHGWDYVLRTADCVSNLSHGFRGPSIYI